MSDHFFGPPMEKLLKLVGEILVEVRALRADYAEGQAVCVEVDDTFILSDIDSIEFNKSYEG